MRVLLSVANKEGLRPFAEALHDLGAELIATAGTADDLRAANLPVRDVAELTGSGAILGGRVKTLHPVIFAGLLAKRDDPAQMNELSALGYPSIDVVVCNLYPFAQAAAQPDVTEAELLEEIDIGGVALLRAAAKNYPAVTVIARPGDYDAVLDELHTSGTTSERTRKRLAVAAFQHTAAYDAIIAGVLREQQQEDPLAEDLTVALHQLERLRYGENPHQAAALYRLESAPPTGHGRKGVHDSSGRDVGISTVAGARVVQGKELSFNNLLDLDAALACVSSFTSPTTVIVKHTNPCGLACSDSLAESYRHAHAGDPVSAYGGIIGCNREVDAETATLICQIFYEAIIAPSYSAEALAILSQKKNMRVLATDHPIAPLSPAGNTAHPQRLDVRSISGGLLIQTADVFHEQDLRRTVVTEREPTLDEVTGLLFAWKVVQHVKSNAIVLAKHLQVVGVGAGQMNRVYSVQIAADRAADRARGSVLASDAFFPFPDGVEVAAKAGVTAIIQPGGSIRDNEAIRMANRYGIAMVLTGQRHFRH